MKKEDGVAGMAVQSWYEILGVAPNAGASEIQNAYRREALRWHPERHVDGRQAEERFRKIGMAYKTLSDPALRAEYDVWLATGAVSGKGAVDKEDGVDSRTWKILAFSAGLMEAEAARLFFEQMLMLSAELKYKGYRGRQRLKMLETLGCPCSVVRAVAERMRRSRRQPGRSSPSDADLPVAVELAEWAQIKPYYAALIGGDHAGERMDEATYRKHLANFNRSLAGYVTGLALLLAGIALAGNGPLSGWLAVGGVAALILTLVWRWLTGASMAFHREKAMRRYLPAFKRFHNGEKTAAGGSRFNIGGFFGSIYWLAYRRMSRDALIGVAALAALGWIQLIVSMKFDVRINALWVGAAIAIAMGLGADRIYFEHARRRIDKVSLYPRRQALAQLREEGGVSRMCCLGYLVLSFVLSLPLGLYQASLKTRRAMLQEHMPSTEQRIADHAARQKLAAEAAARSAQIRKEQLAAAIAETEARYPQIDPRHPRYDRKLAERVSARMQNHVRQGADPARARRMAAAEIGATAGAAE